MNKPSNVKFKICETQKSRWVEPYEVILDIAQCRILRTALEFRFKRKRPMGRPKTGWLSKGEEDMKKVLAFKKSKGEDFEKIKDYRIFDNEPGNDARGGRRSSYSGQRQCCSHLVSPHESHVLQLSKMASVSPSLSKRAKRVS
jgi:hypothetical protein